MARSIHRRLREIHGPDVEVTLLGRADRRRPRRFTVQPLPKPRRSWAWLIVSAPYYLLVAVAIGGLALLIWAALSLVLALAVYAALLAFGVSATWAAWTALGVAAWATLLAIMAARRGRVLP